MRLSTDTSVPGVLRSSSPAVLPISSDRFRYEGAATNFDEVCRSKPMPSFWLRNQVATATAGASGNSLLTGDVISAVPRD